MRQIALVGRGWTGVKAPLPGQGWEVWGLAHATARRPPDRLFEMHLRSRYQTWRGHLGHLGRHQERLWLQFPDPELPRAQLLPVDMLAASYRDYFDTSLAYMAAWAAHTAPARLAIFGCEFPDQGQRHCFEFWLGVACGRGVEVLAPAGHGPLAAPPTRYR